MNPYEMKILRALVMIIQHANHGDVGKSWEKYSQTCGCGALHKLQSYINILRVGLCGFDVARV